MAIEFSAKNIFILDSGDHYLHVEELSRSSRKNDAP